MSWFKSIFSSKDSQKSNEEFQKITNTNMDDYLDIDFIDALYFKNHQSKDNYINSVKNILGTIAKDGGVSRVKISEYITGNEIDIPFLMDAIKTDNYNGKLKLDRYYTALGISKYNICEKIETDHYDFDFEESLAGNAFKSDHRNYARIETLFMLGQAFFKKKELAKMNIYFAVIYDDKYDLSDATVSNFHRSIGNIYFECDNKIEALRWYRSGLTLNSKLGVKKLIINLEKEINGS